MIRFASPTASDARAVSPSRAPGAGSERAHRVVDTPTAGGQEPGQRLVSKRQGRLDVTDGNQFLGYPGQRRGGERLVPNLLLLDHGLSERIERFLVAAQSSECPSHQPARWLLPVRNRLARQASPSPEQCRGHVPPPHWPAPANPAPPCTGTPLGVTEVVKSGSGALHERRRLSVIPETERHHAHSLVGGGDAFAIARDPADLAGALEHVARRRHRPERRWSEPGC